MKDKFKEIGYNITDQAITIINQMDKKDEKVKVIIEQLKSKSPIVTGSDIVKFLITGRVGGV